MRLFALLLLLAATAHASIFDDMADAVTRSWAKGGHCLEAAKAVDKIAKARGLQSDIWILETRDSMNRRIEARKLGVAPESITHAVAVVYDGKLWRVYDYLPPRVTQHADGSAQRWPGAGAWKTHKHPPRPDHHRDWELDGAGSAFTIKRAIGKMPPVAWRWPATSLSGLPARYLPRVPRGPMVGQGRMLAVAGAGS